MISFRRVGEVEFMSLNGRTVKNKTEQNARDKSQQLVKRLENESRIYHDNIRRGKCGMKPSRPSESSNWNLHVII